MRRLLRLVHIALLAVFVTSLQTIGTTSSDAAVAEHPSSDFDGDGRDDLAVGVPGQMVAGMARAGAVIVLPGSADGVVTAESGQGIGARR
ncbi:MAG: integrin alpha [Actinomycetota bacterium]